MVVDIFPTHEWRLHLEVTVGLLLAEGKCKLTLEIKEDRRENRFFLLMGGRTVNKLGCLWNLAHRF